MLINIVTYCLGNFLSIIHSPRFIAFSKAKGESTLWFSALWNLYVPLTSLSLAIFGPMCFSLSALCAVDITVSQYGSRMRFGFSVSLYCQLRWMQFRKWMTPGMHILLGGADRKPSIEQASGACSPYKGCQQETSTFSFHKWVWSCMGEVGIERAVNLDRCIHSSKCILKSSPFGNSSWFKHLLLVCVQNLEGAGFPEKASWYEKRTPCPRNARKTRLGVASSMAQIFSNLKLLLNTFLHFSICQYGKNIFLFRKKNVFCFVFLVEIILTWPNSKHNSDNEVTFHGNHLGQYLQCLHSDA